jgi:hypothetical protein
MQTVEKIAQEIVHREGGYVNDPDDPGGATNFGVTIHTMRRLGLDLDRNGDVDAFDLRALTQTQAVDIFIKHYFDAPLIAHLPEPLHATVFDMYVNAGGNAIKVLQRLLWDMGFEVSVDGALGPRSHWMLWVLQVSRPMDVWWTLTALRGATIICALQIAAQPAASMRAPVRAKRADGYCGPRNLWHLSII